MDISQKETGTAIWKWNEKFPTLVTREMEMKITKGYHFPPTGKARKYNAQCWQSCETTGAHIYSWWKWKWWKPFGELLGIFLESQAHNLSVPPPVGFDPIICTPTLLPFFHVFHVFIWLLSYFFYSFSFPSEFSLINHKETHFPISILGGMYVMI